MQGAKRRQLVEIRSDGLKPGCAQGFVEAFRAALPLGAGMTARAVEELRADNDGLAPRP